MRRTRHLIAAFAALCFSAFSTTIHAQGPPPNDHCEDVTPLPLAIDSALVFSGNNEGATFDGDNVPGSGLDAFGQPVVWIAFTTTQCSDVSISFCGSTAPFLSDYFWEVLTPQCPADELIFTTDYNNNECPDGQPVIHHNELPAGTYYYPVWSQPGTAIGDYVITVSATACASAGPPNDLCAGAQQHALDIGATVTITGDNIGATDNDGLGVPVVWESFTLTQCANVTVDYCGTDPAFTANLHGIYADCPATMFIDTTASGNCADGNISDSFDGLAPGTYWIPVLMEADNAEGAYTIHVTATACAGPANNYCNGAELNDLAVGDTLVINGDNTGATDNEGLGFASVWESFTITECADVEVSYCGTDPVFTAASIPGIYAECPAMDLIGPDSISACADGNLVANFEGLAAGTYWIPVVMVPDDAEGAYTINVSATACPTVVTPPNDLCDAIIPNGLALGDALVLTGDNTGATDSEGLGYANVWEAITIAECANVTVDYCGTDTAFSAFAMGIYADCPATQLIPATTVDSCANGNMVQTFEGLTPGTYYIPVLMDTATAVGMYAINVMAVACDIVTGPVNDLCSNVLPHVLAVDDTLTLNGDNTGATDSEGLGYANVWESIVFTECATITLDYCSTDSTFSTFAMGIYSDCPATQLVQPSSTDTCASGSLIQVFEELPAGSYWIPVLMDTVSAVGVYSITATAVACEPVEPPANDLCADAASISVVAPDSCATGAVIGDNLNATGSGDRPTCADPGQNWQDVWYTFNTGTADEVTITLENGTIDGAGMEVFAACGDTSIACSTDGEPIALAVLTDSTYHVRVFTQENGTAGTFVLCITSDNTTGVSSMDRGTVHLYPNPGTGDFTFMPSVSWTDAQITVLDMTGRTVHVEQANLKAGEAYQLSMAGKLKAGSYLFHVTSTEGSTVVKLMVK
ncbi:MAG: T9SS type A sorting domain-containing protein [Flavobacteriales bacterium]